MASGYMLDSDVMMWALRGYGATISLLESIGEKNPVYCSAVSVFEVWAGVRPHEVQQTLEFLEGTEVLPIDRRIASKAGDYWREFRRQRITLGQADLFIAATARIHHLMLLTYNRSDFPMGDIDLFAPMPSVP